MPKLTGRMVARNNVAKWSAQKRAAMNDAIKAAAFIVQAGAAGNAPVDTGALKNSIQAYEINPELWRVEDGVTYGIFQELGTSRSQAKHFLGGAVEKAYPEFQKRIAAALAKDEKLP